MPRARLGIGCICLAMLGLFLLTLPVAAQRGAITRPQNLAELADEASVILRGTVQSARVEPHPDLRGLTTLLVTLRVDETLKGKPAQTYIFRQYLWDVRDRRDGLGYRKGQRVLLLLTAPSQLGLSSPVGLERGRFRIERDAQGREFAVNGHGNAGLLAGLEQSAARKGVPLTSGQARLASEHRAGAIALDDLRGLLRRLAGGQP